MRLYFPKMTENYLTANNKRTKTAGLSKFPYFLNNQPLILRYLVEENVKSNVAIQKPSQPVIISRQITLWEWEEVSSLTQEHL